MNSNIFEIIAKVSKARALLDLATAYYFSSERSDQQRLDTIFAAVEEARDAADAAEQALFSMKL